MSPPFDILASAVDIDGLIPPLHNLIICRRQDGSWRLSFAHNNPRKYRRMVSAEGMDFADALRALGEKIHGHPV